MAEVSVALIGAAGLVSQCYAADPDKSVDQIDTASPIKHVIIIVGENRSFDHLFATYVSPNSKEKVMNLLSEKIINADGSPGLNFKKGHQYKITAAPKGGKYFISADMSAKTLYSPLPVPDVNGVQNPPAAAILTIPGGVQPVRSFRGEHHQSRAEQPRAVEGDGHPAHRR